MDRPDILTSQWPDVQTFVGCIPPTRTYEYLSPLARPGRAVHVPGALFVLLKTPRRLVGEGLLHVESGARCLTQTFASIESGAE